MSVGSIRTASRLSSLLAIAFAARSAAAQRITGQVTEAGSGTPVRGAVVSLVDSAGRTLARTVSGADGTYQLLGDGHTRTVRVIRIGFRPDVRTVPPTPADAGRSVDLALSQIPAVLEAVEVHDQSRCPANREAPLAFAIWEQARAALLASVVAREASPASVRALLYERDLDIRGTHVEKQSIVDSVFKASRAFVSGRAAADFDRRGYVDTDQDHERQRYYAPDAEVLLDSTFVRGHCLSLATPTAEHSDDIGLAFVPAPTADPVVDIRGTIWVTRERPTLRSMDFEFTNIEHAATAVNAGNTLTFSEAPNGVEFERSWNIHIPILALHEVRFRGRAMTGVRLVGSHDSGGELAEISWADGTIWRGQLARIRGHVTDAGTSTPASDAIVRVVGTPFETIPDDSGTFTIPPILPGHYVLEAVDTLFAEFGLPASHTVALDVGRAPIDGISLTVPSRDSLVDGLCAASRKRTPGGFAGNDLLVGRVVFANGTPAPNATLRVRWPSDDVKGNALRYTSRTDSTGAFAVCGLPRGVPLSLSAARDTLVSADSVLAADSSRHVGRASLTLSSPAVVNLPAYRRRRIVVTDARTHQRVPDVEVLDALFGRSLGRTTATNGVSLASLADGTSLLRLRKPGYEQLTMLVQMRPADTLPVYVDMRTVTQLEAVQVTATATTELSRLAGNSGFLQRANAGLGHFLRPEDFEKSKGRSLMSMLTMLGMRQSLRKGRTVLSGGHRREFCPATVYIDGMPFYSGLIGGDPPDFGNMLVEDFIAAEYFAGPAETPAELTTSGIENDCGTLSLWRRD